MKITFIGAGSVHFTTAVVHDITTFPALDGAEICLMDIDAYRLKKITECVERIKTEMGSNISITWKAKAPSLRSIRSPCMMRTGIPVTAKIRSFGTRKPWSLPEIPLNTVLPATTTACMTTW